VPRHNAAACIGATMESIAIQEWSGDWEVVVADNGSTDESVAIVESYRPRLPQLRIVRASGLQSRAHACNVGVSASRGSMLLFLDSDDVLADGYVAAMAQALREHHLVCARIDVDALNPDWTRLGRPSPQFDRPGSFHGFLPQAFGGALGVRRDLYGSLGGYDESLRWAEDRDFTWRAQLDAHVDIVFVPEAVLHYRYRDTLRGIYAQARNWSRQNRQLRRRFEPRGMPPGPRFLLARQLRGLVKNCGRLGDPAGRAYWFRRLGEMVGETEGRLRRRPWI